MAKRQDQGEGFDWQVGVWDKMSEVYVGEIERRFEPVSDALVRRANLRPGEDVLDIGVGTGAITRRAARAVGAGGSILGIDISADMLDSARRHLTAPDFANVSLRLGSAEEIPAEDGSLDVVLASLSLMYVIDRDAAAQEIARVLRPGGRLVASVWASADECDIVLFQQTAGRFSGPPPIEGVGPGALADPAPFLERLAASGIVSHLEQETFGFEFPDFNSAWEALAGVTTSQLPKSRQEEARRTVLNLMYPNGDGARYFRNRTLFIVGLLAG